MSASRAVPAFRVERGQHVRHARRTWRVQTVDLVAVYAAGERRDPRLRLRLSDGRGHHVSLTVEQTDPIKVVAL